MHWFPRILLLFCLPVQSLIAQEQSSAADGLVGIYRSEIDPSLEFRVSREGRGLRLQILGQGTLDLAEKAAGLYQLSGVQPAVTIEFVKDGAGHIVSCRVHQDEPPHTWLRIPEGTAPAGKPAPAGNPAAQAGYAGDYRMDINPYAVIHIRERAGLLSGYAGSQKESPLRSLGPRRYSILLNGNAYTAEFKAGKDGRIDRVVTSGRYPHNLLKISSSLPHISGRANGFTRADSLQGMLTPLRSCYDVLFYHLDLTVLPETKSVRGSNLIRWRTVHSFRRMQVDLYANLAIDTILYRGRSLDYTRDGNAVYIDLPAPVDSGATDELRVAYSGCPLQPDLEAMKGGIFWLWNRDRDLWIESVTQGIGASVFWPCKDHLSDRPDSMAISITVPGGLTDISNGRLLRQTRLPGGQTRFDWYVDYPIVTYDVAINVGNYVQLTDSYIRGGDTLPLHFYCMPYNRDSARAQFADIPRMLALYEKDFGPWPFPRDGFTVLESIYPMEHQGAVSIGSMRAPFNSDQYDGDIRRVMWHESAHEWWGNNVGCSDYADLWIHESFANYAEFLNRESLWGRPAAVKQLNSDQPENKEPVIGVYNVNHFHTGDMYSKGALMLQTLRNIIGNDSLWFSIFRGIQQRFRYTPVRTEDIVAYFSEATGKDYRYLFDQYLRSPAIPVLDVTLREGGDRLILNYRWQADVAGFQMPIKVTLAKGQWGWIYPTASWQTMELKDMRRADFAVDTEDFYAAVKLN